jgi:hypothetical protein
MNAPLPPMIIMRSAGGDMKWDPELSALAIKVRDTFGRRALADAYVRALAATPHASCPPELEELIAHDVNIKIVDGSASTRFLKDELRRMLAVH